MCFIYKGLGTQYTLDIPNCWVLKKPKVLKPELQNRAESCATFISPSSWRCLCPISHPSFCRKVARMPLLAHWFNKLTLISCCGRWGKGERGELG